MYCLYIRRALCCTILKRIMHRLALVVATVASLCTCRQLDHVTGTQHLVRVFIHNRYLAVRPDGTVGGTTHASMDTILQRVGYHKSRVLLQNAFSCMHVCLDRCGAMYASGALSMDCILNEVILDNNYDVMFKIYNRKKTYVALNNKGRPRRVQLPKRRPLRKMSTHTFIMRIPLNYTSVSKCPKQNKIIRHRKCRRHI
ncbi:fibroblast growth factor [Choristoneura rosaceana nucleopolyhedrovirus]|uniref:Fibroblast growth factor n=1 Tax=Choristoneura rosaceana nucleopolyhedrovirus TaxID=58094 RepID=S5N451_9ABAC|nr:fibroblast growth factor [Choristoneura rosaceana nucleopolyhedrovirus]AGR57160.1 fibroblast growth factor [Choristoneura rosaceana nucleopolyhedrovirus]